LKAVREKKQITYKGKPIKIIDFPTETLKAKRARREVFQALNEITSTLGYSTQENCHSKIAGEIKIFHNKQKLKQYMTTKLSLQKILQGLLHTEDESKQNHENTGSSKQQEKKRQAIRQ
jgi:hypothetical protein